MGSSPILRRISTFRNAECELGSTLEYRDAPTNTNLLFTDSLFGLSLLGLSLLAASYSG
jgi:hypothetical protein